MRITIKSNTPLTQPPRDYCPPGSDRWFTIPEGPDAGKKMFYYDWSTGDEKPEATIFFVHGNPENSYTYRHVRDSLVTSGKPIRIIAMDHIGFGLSDQATFEMVDMHHAANLLQLIQYLGVTDVTLVVHDWGGPIGIGAFIKEPHRVRNLAVLNTTIFPMPREGYRYTNYPDRWLPWSRAPEVVADFLWGGVAAYAVSNGSPQGSLKIILNSIKYLFLHGARLIPRDTPEYVWSQSLRTKNNARSSKRNVRQTPKWGHGYQYDDPTLGTQDNHAFYRHMQKEVPARWGPNGQNIDVCGYFGEWDPCGKPSVVRQWQTALPKITKFTFTFENVGHFIEEYKGPEIAASIIQMNSQPS